MQRGDQQNGITFEALFVSKKNGRKEERMKRAETEEEEEEKKLYTTCSNCSWNLCMHVMCGRGDATPYYVCIGGG